jgi:hypothetical protein
MTVNKIWIWTRWVLGVVVAICVAVFISFSILQDDLLAGCERTSDFKVLNARNWEGASAVRRDQGDIATANLYKSNARRMRQTIPVDPPDNSAHRGDRRSSRVAGCENAYPPPIPWIE